jgi:selenocysteine lyase/cysteine desulfurase
VSAFEDGTPNYYAIAAVDSGFDLVQRVDRCALSQRVTTLIDVARTDMAAETHANGEPVFRIYGPESGDDRGGTVAVNLLDAAGRVIPYESVEHAARDAGLAVRGGCFCNPGASETAFGFPAHATRRCLQQTSREPFTPRRFGECLGAGIAVGAIRISVGLATTEDDVITGVRALARIGLGEVRSQTSDI